MKSLMAPRAGNMRFEFSFKNCKFVRVTDFDDYGQLFQLRNW